MAETLYRDFANSFEPNPNTGDVSVVTNDEAIRQSMKNLVLTNYKERLHQPKKGCGMGGLLFDLSTPLTKLSLEESIISVLNTYEPRIVVLSVDVTDLSERNAYKINVKYVVKTSAKTLTFDFLLTRVR